MLMKRKLYVTINNNKIRKTNKIDNFKQKEKIKIK